MPLGFGYNELQVTAGLRHISHQYMREQSEMEMDEIGRGWTVFTEDGKRVGDVVEVHPHYLLVSRGLLVVRDVFVPRYAVSAAGERKVHLAITDERLRNMAWTSPPPPPPPEVDSPSPRLVPLYDDADDQAPPLRADDATSDSTWASPAHDYGNYSGADATGVGDESGAFDTGEVYDDYEDMGIVFGATIEVDSEAYLAVRKLEAPYQAGISPVVFIHGWGVDSRIWDYLTVDLPRDRTVVTYDARGYGRSTAPWNGYTVEQASRDLRVLLRTLDLQKATLVGLDIGATAALHYVLNGGRRAARLVLVSPAWPSLQEEYVEGLPEPFETWQHGLRRDRPRLAPKLAEMWAPDASPEARRWLQDSIVAAANHALVQGLNTLSWPHVGGDLETIALPTVVLHGRDDPVIALERGERLAAVIPGARLVVLDAPGHLPMIADPERFAAALLSVIETDDRDAEAAGDKEHGTSALDDMSLLHEPAPDVAAPDE